MTRINAPDKSTGTEKHQHEKQTGHKKPANKNTTNQQKHQPTKTPGSRHTSAAKHHPTKTALPDRAISHTWSQQFHCKERLHCKTAAELCTPKTSRAKKPAQCVATFRLVHSYHHCSFAETRRARWHTVSKSLRFHMNLFGPVLLGMGSRMVNSMCLCLFLFGT